MAGPVKTTWSEGGRTRGPDDSSDAIRVLVVDDDPSILETVEAILEDDFEVTCCSSGAEALQLVEQAPFDVVCTDYKMPGMDGVELVTRLATLDLSIGAVLMTGKAEAYFKEQFQSEISKTVPLSVVLKPYRVDELMDAIRRAAAFVRMRRAVTAAGRSVRRFKESPP